jgi:hypothetical protein
VAVLLDDEVVHGVEFRHLRYLVAIADAGRFTHAAERMFVTQPTLSHQIRRSEEMAGTPLLHRRPEGVRLTEAGSVQEPDFELYFILTHRRRVSTGLHIGPFPGILAFSQAGATVA